MDVWAPLELDCGGSSMIEGEKDSEQRNFANEGLW